MTTPDEADRPTVWCQHLLIPSDGISPPEYCENRAETWSDYCNEHIDDVISLIDPWSLW